MNLLQVRKMMLFTAQKMIESEPTLTALDQLVGDGDHGIGMKRGFTAIMVLLQDEKFQPTNIGDFFTQIGTKLMISMGGASGAIFGTLFRAGGKSITGVTEFDSDVLSKLLNEGWQAVYQRGKAKPGDKTMVDALAASATTASQLTSTKLIDALPKIAQSAMEGAEKTKQMIAVFGRTKNLGERAIGHMDPGAASMAYILKYMNEYIQTQ
ncbi:dihydroxyacetone kinase subunit L [Gilliamella sp. Fer1-1]|jgi:phosphoenolpyruvate---glycerone phosphotransferase subunit DhaL|uniref:dihydroxyacetone kinase subunit DhaL n=1 Tax=unclassified Gilliamella TaxID=2685620 RepID=UPI00080DFD3B|nr:dihydroxyacetone kinase subunit DhaL [Gilliamella apicola]OCG29529.1 dihydroxyacetone kinase subunit L [Gilliamella apicola]OCG29722.1 dihydroxyacetone kinase subunit L [Gilliamella apicola]OCG44662.1 dihydroxyacetone kinase subunit L [Gilliamella apicola]